MKFWAKVRGDELYIVFNPGDPGAWELVYPSAEDTALCESLTPEEVEQIDEQITAIICDPNAWDDGP